jgi:serpin B
MNQWRGEVLVRWLRWFSGRVDSGGGDGDASPGAGETVVSAASPRAPAPRQAGLQAFVLDLYRHADRSGNLVLSPLSIAAALALLELGASGRSAAALHALLGIDEPAAFREAFVTLLASLDGGAPTQWFGTHIHPHRLRFASGVWSNARWPLREAFVDASSRYGAVAQPLDPDDAARSADRINDWVRTHTRGAIPSVVSADDLGTETRLLVVNALHFVGRWREPFDASFTTQGLFHAHGTRPVQVPMMRKSEEFASFADDEVALVDLPYWSASPDVAMVMTVVLPRRRDGLPAVEAALDADWLEARVSQMAADRPVHVTLPKWRASATLQLRETLTRLGAGVLFEAGDDFDGVAAGAPGLDDVVHRTTISVDERGTEAAAATTVLLLGIGGPAEPLVFRADHPFLYLIRELGSGTVVFVGRVVDPSAG